MGQKVNPIGYRLAVNRDWRSRWYASPKELPEFLGSDLKIRAYVKDKLRLAAVAKIVIERAWNSIRVTIFTARPGIVIGRKGTEIENMTKTIETMSNGKSVKIDIQEIKTPELDAQLVAENVALQIERRRDWQALDLARHFPAFKCRDAGASIDGFDLHAGCKFGFGKFSNGGRRP